MNHLRRYFHNFIQFSSNPAVLFYVLPWLMTLLVGGTVAQRYIGLYPSQKLFFGSFILWLGWVPAPGAYTALSVIALGMMIKIVFYSPWKKKQAGVIVTHASILLLLLGGLVTALSREEGYMILGQDDTDNIVSDYHQRELVILKNHLQILAIPYAALHEKRKLEISGLGILTITKTCFPCSINSGAQRNNAFKGIASEAELSVKNFSNEEAENQPAIAFDITGAGKDQDGNYIESEALSQHPVLIKGKDIYEIHLRAEQRPLPFLVRLKHFDKQDYPGTTIAQSYRSDVMVEDGALSWNAVVEMNQPLRYRGYTVYQSSFIEKEGKLFTVLAVVKNAGAIFPYIAVAILCTGLLIHVIITLRWSKHVR